MIKTLTFFFFLLKTSIRASISIRGAFIFESILMILNHLIFFSIWWIFFQQFDDIAGWKIEEITTLMAVGIGAYGLMQISCGGIKQLSSVIINGDLDPFMTQPKNLLVHFIASKSLAKGWGNLMSASVLVFLGKLTSPSSLLIVALGIVCGCLVFTSAGIIMHSLSFWLGHIESLSHRYCESLFLFALYPTNIYSDFMQIVMFTLVPAGVIGYLPVELIRNFSWFKIFLTLGTTLIFCLLSFLIFYLGLKRYESGNKFGFRL